MQTKNTYKQKFKTKNNKHPISLIPWIIMSKEKKKGKGEHLEVSTLQHETLELQTEHNELSP